MGEIMKPAYYNENDPKMAAWLHELIKADLIADGLIDERSIADVTADDLKGFSQCHFFAGIGGWSYALRLAGWPDDRPVWTGSCPCQPFSAAGKGRGTKDERHLWPEWFRLIRKCKPVTIFGEQVEAAINHGWLDLVSSDLEREGYRVGAIGLPACGVGAPHIRQRLWFVADTGKQRLEGLARNGNDRNEPGRLDENTTGSITESCEFNRLADSKLLGCECQPVIDSAGIQRTLDTEERPREPIGAHSTSSGRMGNTEHNGSSCAAMPGCAAHTGDGSEEGQDNAGESEGAGGAVVPGTVCNWQNPDWLYCRDDKWRPVEPGLEPLANGIPERVVRLRGYGNAIVPQVAAEVIKTYMEEKP